MPMYPNDPANLDRLLDLHMARTAEGRVNETAPWNAGRRLAFGVDSLRVLGEALELGIRDENLRATQDKNDLLADFSALRRKARRSFHDVKQALTETRERAAALEEEEKRLQGALRDMERAAGRHSAPKQHVSLDPDDLTAAHYQRLATLSAQVLQVQQECVALKADADRRRERRRAVELRHREAESTVSRLKAAVAVSLQEARDAFDRSVLEKEKDAAAYSETLAVLGQQVQAQLHSLEGEP